MNIQDILLVAGATLIVAYLFKNLPQFVNRVYSYVCLCMSNVFNILSLNIETIRKITEYPDEINPEVRFQIYDRIQQTGNLTKFIINNKLDFPPENIPNEDAISSDRKPSVKVNNSLLQRIKRILNYAQFSIIATEIDVFIFNMVKNNYVEIKDKGKIITDEPESYFDDERLCRYINKKCAK